MARLFPIARDNLTRFEVITMSKSLSRLFFALWIAGAPLSMVGCSEGDKPATTTPATTTDTTVPSATSTTPTTTPEPVK